MIRSLGQLHALLWKNWILQRRRPWGVVVQIVLPCLFYLAFGVIRMQLIPPEDGDMIPSNPSFPLPRIVDYASWRKFAYYPMDNTDVNIVIDNVRTYGCKQWCNWDANSPCVGQCLDSFKNNTLGFETASDLQNYLEKNKDSVWAAIGFVDSRGNALTGPITNDVHYQLRFDGTKLPYNDELFLTIQTGPTDSGSDYLDSGFISLQVAVDQSLMWFFNGTTTDKTLTVQTQEYPYPKYTTNIFYQSVKDSLAFYTCLSFVYFVIRLVSQIVVEKETKIKEAMKIMGLGEIVYWSSWFISSFVIMTLAMLLVTITSKFFTVFEKSDFILIFFFFEVWGLSIISFCFLISVFFSKSKVASSVSVIVLFVALVPNIKVTNTSSAGTQFGGCLLSPTCLSVGLQHFCDYEERQIGVTWENVDEGDFSYTGIVWTMIFDIFIYGFLAWYLEEVLPQEYGVRRKWYFIFQPSYWATCFSDRRSVIPKNYNAVPNVGDVDENTEPVTAEVESTLTVDIKNLKKEFTIKTKTHTVVKTAVDNLNLKMYENQITALLGHNGAGKTTTMSMLTGFLSPSSGDASIYGSSILDNIESIRENIGYCPQYNVLWDDLTVQEHVELFAALKGVPRNEISAHAAERIQEVGMNEKMGSYSKTLSGGQKRKLCVAIAFTGGTKLIFLDEPTSGMDPFSRRAVWDLLQNLKKGRTIVLTTHFMDEADLLGDRIAIMSAGRLAACGSSLFLKSRYGIGYSLTMVKKPTCQESIVTSYLGKFHPSISVLSNVGAELSYVLPQSAVSKFGELFANLERDKDSMGIDSYGLSVTTLEEVFLRLADRVGVEVEKQRRVTQSQRGDVEIPMERILEGKMTANKFYDGEITYTRSYPQQFKALLMKRFLVSWRDSKALFQMIFYPTVFVLLAVVISNSIKTDRNIKLLKLSYTNMQEFNTFLYSDNTTTPNSADNLFKNVITYAGYPVNLVTTAASGINQYLLKNPDIRSSAIIQEANPSKPTYSYTAMYDTNAYHSLPIGINYVNNAIIRQYIGKDVRINAANLPLPVFDLSGADYAKSFNLALYVGIAVCIIPGALITSVVREREVKATHQQLVSGAKPILLWATYLISDMALYLLFCIIIFIIFAGAGTKAFIGRNFFQTLITLLSFGLSGFPFTYILSYAVRKPSAVQSKITTWYIVYSLASLIIISILYSTESTSNSAKYIDYIFTLVPPYAVSIGIFYISINDIAKDVPGLVEREPFDWKISGRPITFMLVEFVVFSLVLVLFEKGYFDRLLYPPEPTHVKDLESNEVADADVSEEERRVAGMTNHTDAVIVKNLRKVYSNDLTTKIAVKNLSFAIPEGECFGLLGPNGAGKTTTLSILSGDYRPTGGDAWLRGTSILGRKKDIFRAISLCPQFDPLLDLMTGREHLYLFGRLRGVPEDKLEIIADNALRILDLEQHADKLTQAYSGGNKRKLSLAIAMLGDPKILFLDEPSTGMDPLARRFMWNVISSFTEGRSIILTTHSMEECEALCTRIGIMVNGRMKCLGSSQHLKNKFGTGYRLELQTTPEAVERVKEFIQSSFSGANLIEWHGGKLHYQIPGASMNLGTVFSRLEERRTELSIQDYALSQTTLEQVFVYFAHQQEAEPEANK